MTDQQTGNTILHSIRTLFNFRIKPKQLNVIITWQFTLLWTRKQTVFRSRSTRGQVKLREPRVFVYVSVFASDGPSECLCVCKYGFGPRGASRGSLRVRWHLSVLTLKSFPARTSVHEHPNMPCLQKTNTIPHRVTFPIIPSGCVCVCCAAWRSV